MTTINSSPPDQAAATSTPSPKRCPFCNGQAEVVGACGQGFGVRCAGCGVLFPAIYRTCDEVIALWAKRAGIPSWFGGKATKGISTRRKRRACRRNLKKARQRKQIKRIRADTEAIMPQLQAARAPELADLQAAAAQSRARLKALEPIIMADPQLSRIYALLPKREPDPSNGRG